MGILICASIEEEALTRLTTAGPRRDFLELARSVGGRVLYRHGSHQRYGWRARLLGPHVRQAWAAAAEAQAGDVVFADGEHIGIPLSLFLRLRRRRARVVMLGHFLSKPWKRLLLAVATRAGVGGTVLVHSVLQRKSVAGAIGGRWSVVLVPYQVDTAYWSGAHVPGGRTVLAVGAESRDYATLIRAVGGLDVDLRIAAGSHWARASVAAASGGERVTWIREPLPFADLREEYLRARCVVVPLHNVPNQSGVTTVLEAMSHSLPVVVTATEGQREVVAGPLMTRSGIRDEPTSDRGPAAFGATSGNERSGLYVPPGDPVALRRAIVMLLEDPSFADRLGGRGREVAVRHLSLEGYVERLAAVLRSEERQLREPVAEGVPA